MADFCEHSNGCREAWGFYGNADSCCSSVGGIVSHHYTASKPEDHKMGGSEPSGSTNGQKFLELLSDYELLKKDSAACC
jgi:hypothetical protein